MKFYLALFQSFFLLLLACNNPSNSESHAESTGSVEIQLEFPEGIELAISDSSYLTVSFTDSEGNSIKTVSYNEIPENIIIYSVPSGNDYSVNVSFQILNKVYAGDCSNLTITENSSAIAKVFCIPSNIFQSDLNRFYSFNSAPDTGVLWRQTILEAGKAYSAINKTADTKLLIYDGDFALLSSIDGKGVFQYTSILDDTLTLAAFGASTSTYQEIGILEFFPLHLETYQEGAVATGADHVCYGIPVTGGKTYQIKWDDCNTGNCNYTGDIRIRYLDEDFSNSYIHYSGNTLTVGENDSILFLYVYPYQNDGTYGFKVIPYEGSVTIIIQ